MDDEIVELKSSRQLLDALKSASSKKITANELEEQRASFVFSSMGSNSAITKSQVKQFLAEHDCK